MKKLLIIVLICSFVLAQNAYAYKEIRVSENMQISIPPDDMIYINVLIPDDLGVVTGDEIEYVIKSSASPDWDDLTEQSVTTDIYNTALIPIQFSAVGKRDGSCSGPFQITLSSQALGESRTWNGEVCVSGYADIDIKPVESSDTGPQTMNNNMDLFDIDFTPPEKIAKPGEDVDFTLNLVSYADLDFDISLGDELEMSIDDDTVSTSSNPRRDVTVTVTAPDTEGIYEFTAKTTAFDCDEQFCKRTATGRLRVTETTVPDTVFSISIFPNGLNIKNLDPIEYEATIDNPGQAKTFELELVIPEGFSTDFNMTEITVNSGETRKIKFTVTPEEDFGFELIQFYASYDKKRKMATAQLSSNEMMSDTEREADELLSRADSETADEINSAMSEWEASYSSSEYGQEFSEYGTIKDRLRAASEKLDQQEPEDGDDLVIISEPEEPSNPFNPLIIVAIIAPIAAVIAFVVYKKRSSEDIDDLEI